VVNIVARYVTNDLIDISLQCFSRSYCSTQYDRLLAL